MPVDYAGNSPDKARKLDINSNAQSFRDRVDNLDLNDFYSFNLSSRSSFHLQLDGLKADADVELIRDANNNGQFDQGEVLTASTHSGKQAESINQILDAGTYYLRVYPDGNAKTNYKLSVSATPIDNASSQIISTSAIPIDNAGSQIISTSATPIDNAGNSRKSARAIAVDSKSSIYTDWVGRADNDDYYSFNLSTTSDFNLTLNGLTADADVQLQNVNGDIIAKSLNVGIKNESITRTLDTGTYYVRVYSYNGSETFYNLSLSAKTATATPPNPKLAIATSADTTNLSSVETQVSANSAIITPTSPVNNTNIVAGTLRADTFNFQSGFNRTIYSGNGNVDYGSGARDLLNLSQFASTSVTTNYADNLNGGVVYNAGKGNNLYDAITFSDGSQILFQGIETIQFQDITVNLSVTPNDPLFNQQWDLHITGVQDAWRFSQGNNKVAIGIADTGLGANSSAIHPDLRSTSLLANNYFDESATYSHGTRVEGTIAAASNNGVGIAGINSISPVEMIDVVGGDSGDYDLVQATQTLIDWANTQGQRLVVNLSLSGGSSLTFEQLVTNNKDNVLFVIAAGNQDLSTIASPASLAQTNNNVMAIGSSWGTKDWYGNPKTPGERISYAGWWGSNTGPGLTLTAPSEFVTTDATRTDSSATYGFGYYDRFNGTSASTA
ncbi:MAG: pre-peptidase C-terminal domain-containing protein, partial [Hassallia sp.]